MKQLIGLSFYQPKKKNFMSKKKPTKCTWESVGIMQFYKRQQFSQCQKCQRDSWLCRKALVPKFICFHSFQLLSGTREIQAPHKRAVRYLWRAHGGIETMLADVLHALTVAYGQTHQPLLGCHGQRCSEAFQEDKHGHCCKCHLTSKSQRPEEHYMFSTVTRGFHKRSLPFCLWKHGCEPEMFEKNISSGRQNHAGAEVILKW